jgi:hypothetical protein
MTKCLDRSYRSARGAASSFGLRISFVILISSFPLLSHQPVSAQDDRGFVFDVAWQTERIELADGRVLRGLIEEESPGHVRFFEVRRRPGRMPTLVLHYLAKDEIEKLDRLPEQAHAELARRVDAVENRAAIETGRKQDVHLDSVDRDGVRWWTYAGPWFRLEAALEQWDVRTIVVRLEQMFLGFEQVLGDSGHAHDDAHPEISFLVFGDHGRYAAYLRHEGLAIRNPAFFDPAKMLVVVSSNLSRLQQLEAAVEADHDRRLRELAPRDRAGVVAALATLDRRLQRDGYTDAVRSRIVSLAAARWREEQRALEKQVQRANSQNNSEVYKEQQNLERRLFHEAFHAYAQRDVLPVGRPGNPSHNEASAPLWLAEGLAQIFESALFEADDLLRIDAPDPERLSRLQEDLFAEAPLRLADLLVADQASFLVPHDASGRTSERHYLYAWGLAYYLAFEHAGLSATQLREYAADKSEPLAAFERLVGTSLPDFEARWRKAMRERM